MIFGSVTSELNAVIRLLVRGPQGQEAEIEGVIDTGFDGSLTLPPRLVATLGLERRGRGRAFLADGTATIFDVYEVSVVWDGHPVQILVDEADTDPLVGMALMNGYELRI